MIVIDIENEHPVPAPLEIVANAGRGDILQMLFAFRCAKRQSDETKEKEKGSEKFHERTASS